MWDSEIIEILNFKIKCCKCNSEDCFIVKAEKVDNKNIVTQRNAIIHCNNCGHEEIIWRCKDE